MDRAAAAQAKLPVMVWIHGGGNVIGLSDFYDGGRMAQTQDVVVVTINYRLGPLGWFRHAALREGATPAEQSGNFGTLDLVRALEWVRDDIAAFGGDPGNVTIFGESAGGTNVYTLLLSPLAKRALPARHRGERRHRLRTRSPRPRTSTTTPSPVTAARRTKCWRDSSSRTARRPTPQRRGR